MDTDQVKDKHKRKKDHIPTASKYMQQPGNTRKPGPSRKQMEKERYQNVTGVTAIPSQGQAAQDDNRPRPPTSPVSTESSSALHNAPPILPKQTRPLPRASRSRPAVTSEIRGKDPVKQAAGHLSASAKVKKRSHASIGITDDDEQAPKKETTDSETTELFQSVECLILIFTDLYSACQEDQAGFRKSNPVNGSPHKCKPSTMSWALIALRFAHDEAQAQAKC